MAFQEGKSEMTCAGCKAKHTVGWSRMPVRETYTLSCRKCGGILAQGKSVFDYETPQLI